MFRNFVFLSFTIVALMLAACVPGTDGSESTTFDVTVENVGTFYPVLKSGAVASPGGPDEGPAIFPGETATFSFTAPANTLPMSGMRLNLATMFVQSNDLFYAFPPEGLALYDEDGTAVIGDVTDQLFLYDAGTEVNEQPGVGPNQKPSQEPADIDVGTEENGVVTLIADGEQDTVGFSYPDKTDVIQVTLAHDGDTEFTVSVTNVSEATTLATPGGGVPVPLSPFAWAVHVGDYRLYEVGEAASEGIELIAEDGFPAGMLGGADLPPESGLADSLAEVTGVTVPLSPGAYAVHTSDFSLLEVGSAASDGIEAVAEDGVPTALAGALETNPAVSASGAFSVADGAEGPGAIGPGGSYAFTVEASPDERLSLATMYVQSNDLFYAFNEAGLALFDPDGDPVSGDVTVQLSLYDAGTEVDEEPGVGLNQVIRQGAANTGADENDVVVRIGDGGTDDSFSYAPNSTYIRVTITPQ